MKIYCHKMTHYRPFLSDVVLQVLSFVAENERTNIRQRQAEGIAAAKAKGIRFGRPPKPLPENFHSCYQRWKQGDITGTAAARECGMPLSTFRYRAEVYEKAKLLKPSCCNLAFLQECVLFSKRYFELFFSVKHQIFQRQS